MPSLKNSMKSTNKVPGVLKFEPVDGLLKVQSTGSSFGIDLINKYGTRMKVPIRLGPNPNHFYALFGEDNVDFEISMGGGKFKDERYSLDVHQKNFRFCVPRGFQVDLPVLQTHGESLHFVRLSGEDGQALVAEATHKYGLSFEEAAIMLSQMKVKIDYGSIGSDVYQVDVKTLSGRTFKLSVAKDALVLDVKWLILQLEGIPIKRQKLIFGGKIMDDYKTIDYYKISNNSTIVLALELAAAADSSTPDDSSDESDESWILISDKEREKKKKVEMMEVDERGIICFRKKTDTVFKWCHFSADGNETEPFILEMKMASQFKLL